MKTIEVNVISLHKMLSKKGSYYAIGEFTSAEYGIIRQFMPLDVLEKAIKNQVSPGNVAYLQIDIVKGPDMSLSSRIVGLHTAESIERDIEFSSQQLADEIAKNDVDEDMIQ